MKLFYSDASPYARVVRLLWRQLGVAGVEEIAVNPFEQDEALRRINPLGKIPCLVGEEGALYDSAVIARYLDARFGDGRYHSACEDEWALARDNALLQGLLDAAVALRVEETRRGEGTQSPFWCARHRQALTQGLTQVAPGTWPVPSLLPLKLVALLEYLDFRHPDFDWRARHPELVTWLARQQDAATAATRPA